MNEAMLPALTRTVLAHLREGRAVPWVTVALAAYQDVGTAHLSHDSFLTHLALVHSAILDPELSEERVLRATLSLDTALLSFWRLHRNLSAVGRWTCFLFDAQREACIEHVVMREPTVQISPTTETPA